MGLQIPRDLHSQMSQEDAVCPTAASSWGGVPQAGSTEGQSDRRGPSDAGSRAHDDIDPTKIRGVSGGGVHQGKECDPLGPGLWGTEAKFCRSTLLGPRLLRSAVESRRGAVTWAVRQ